MADEEPLENLVRRLAALVVKLDARNERFDDWIDRQDALNDRLTGAIERIDRTLAQVAMTQADMHRLLARLLPPGENGREA
jgi:ABC-type transporter Mla subunit MlaD